MAYTAVDDIPGLVAGLHETYKSGVTRPLEWRRRQLDNMHRMVDENEEAMVDALKADLRRGRFHSLATEIWDLLGQIVYMKKNLDKFAKKDKIPTPLTIKPLSYEVWKEPYGVVSVIAPWNFPIMLLLNPVVGALAAGNTVVVKPSEIATACSKLITELIAKYFKPSDVAVVTGGVEQTTALLAQKVDTIMYTGGSKVGRIVMAAAAKNLTPVILELGGQCPTYVDESANLEVAARRIVFFKNLNTGQMCIAPNHVLVHHKVRDAFLEHVKKEHARMYPGKEQARAVVLGGDADAEDKFIPFTVVKDPSLDSPLMQEEIFGPILPVVTVQSVEEAIAICTANPATPLAAYVFERDPAVGHKWLTEVPSGGACINDCTTQVLNYEGGLNGKGESGMGTTRGRASFEAFTHRKVVAIQTPNFDPMMKYPPYDGIPGFVKILISQQFPGWVKPMWLGVVGAAAASLVMLVTKHVSISASLPLHEVLAKLRLCVDSDDGQHKVGDTWDLGQGLGVVLLTKPSSLYSPARLAATATASATALPDWLLAPSSPPPPPTSTAQTSTPLPPSPSPSPPPPAPASSPGTTTPATTATTGHRARFVALCDFFARRLHDAIVASPAARANGIHSDYHSETVGQFVLETNRATVSPATGTISVVFELQPAGASTGERPQQHQPGRAAPGNPGGEESGGMGMGVEIEESVRGVIKRALLSRGQPGGGLEPEDACAHVKSVEDQRYLRDLVATSDGIAFVADGSVLPRRSGSDDRPMEASSGAVPFESPESLRREFRLPHRGVVRGMLVPRGVTVIVGGGYHGKSTLLRALAMGVYDKVPGDGRELAVADPRAVTVRAEDGRPVSGVDISPFISSLPRSAAVAAGKATGTAASAGAVGAGAETSGNGGAVAGGGSGSSSPDGGGGGGGDMENTTERFSTGGASGSTSQAANVVEALEAGATALLLDEDTCAGNFIYRVSSLWLELGVSSVIVVGGCGDYFDVHDTAILVDNYTVSDATERAHSISRRFCVGRVQYAGRGLVHRLPWPDPPSPPRAIVPESVLGPSPRKASSGSSAKRKRGCDGHGADGVVEEGAAEEEGGAACLGRTDVSSNGTAPDRSGGKQPPSAGCEVVNGGKPGGTRQRELGGESPPQTDDALPLPSACRRAPCECPCYRGRSDDAYGHAAGRSSVDASSRSIARVGTASADLSRVEQLVGGAAMVRGCALGAGFVARAAGLSPGLSVSGALDLYDVATAARGKDGDGEGGGGGRTASGGGLVSLVLGDSEDAVEGIEEQDEAQAMAMASFCGGPLVALPRRFEVAAAVHRLPGVKFRPAAAAAAAAAAVIEPKETTSPAEAVEEAA
eukprot:g13160.t1